MALELVAAEELDSTTRSPLTPREREVVVLLARGFSNRRIAAELVIAESTAALHVKNVLAKLNFGSRAQIAAWAVGQGLVSAPAVEVLTSQT